jgi:hypothetical protein
MEPKFNLNRPPIGDDEINSKKDFGELVKKFKSESIEKARSDSNFLKNKKITYSTIIAGAVVVCNVTYFAVFKSNPPKIESNEKTITLNQTVTNKATSQIKKIQSPIKKIDVPYQSYKLNAQKGGVITHHTNSKIKVPKNAFINKKGEEIIGDVEIKYRELHNQTDILASGIPLKYDSAGISFNFESAGMFDIKGIQNNEPIYIKKDKTITVEFASKDTTDHFNQYIFDTLAHNWVYLKRDNPLKIVNQNKGILNTSDKEPNPKITALEKELNLIPPKIEKEKQNTEQKISQIKKPKAPIKPNKPIEGREQFELDVDYKDFPELEPYKNALFEVGTENKNLSKDLSSVVWNSAIISEGPKKGQNYILTLKYKDRTEKLIVYPTLTGKDYDEASKQFEKKYSDYKQLLAKKEAEEEKLKAEFEQKMVEYAKEEKRLKQEITQEQIRLQRARAQQMEESFASVNNRVKVNRVFQISTFNIYNSDCPHSIPKGEVINPIFVSKEKKSAIVPEIVYLVCHSKNMILQYGNEPLKYNPNDSYSICIIKNNQIMLCSKEEFSNSVSKGKFTLTSINKEIDNINELKQLIGI